MPAGGIDLLRWVERAHWRAALSALLLSIVGFASCTDQDEPPDIGQADSYRTASVQQWRADLEFLAAQLPVHAPELFEDQSAVRFHQRLEELAASVGALTPDGRLRALAAELARLQDGHTGILLDLVEHLGDRSYPMDLWMTQGNVVIVGTDEAHTDLLGARIVQIGGRSIQDVVSSLELLIPHDRDNSGGAWSDILSYLEAPDVVAAAAITEEVDPLRLVVEDATGVVRAVRLPALAPEADIVLAEGDTPPLWRRGGDEPLWFEHLPTEDATYVKFRSADVGPGAQQEAFRDRTLALEQHLVSKRPSRVIVDLRMNGGGNSERTRWLLHGLIRSGYTKEKGQLFVLTGWRTFSAAVRHCVWLEKHTQAIFVGEPTGGRPNHIGEIRRLLLPHTRLRVRYSAVFHRVVGPGDHRPAIVPDIAASWTVADLRAGRDPALEAALEWKPRPSAADEVRNLVETLPADKAREACAALFGERRNDFDFDFDALIAYGYRLLDEKKIDSAVMLFESLERWRPYEANAHDSLADAYAAAGRAEDAIEHYTRAFELDKRFAHVPDRVRELTTQRPSGGR